MISRMMKLVNSSDNLYLTPVQQKEVVQYARSLQQRFNVARMVKKSESQILELTFNTLQDNHPEVGDIQDSGWESHQQDMTFALRSIVQGMLVDDSDHAGLVSVNSLANQLRHLDFSEDAVTGVFDSLKLACEECMPSDEFELLKSYLDAAASFATKR